MIMLQILMWIIGGAIIGILFVFFILGFLWIFAKLGLIKLMKRMMDDIMQ